MQKELFFIGILGIIIAIGFFVLNSMRSSKSLSITKAEIIGTIFLVIGLGLGIVGMIGWIFQ